MKTFFSKRLNVIAIMLLLGVLMWPEPSWADSIFTIIGNKMVTTVVQLRTIAYVIAAFGLIMFTVLAVFNKISFKHLMYIIVSLWILSAMMPFINYFSGASLSDNTSEQSWGDGLKEQTDAGSDVSKTANCEGETCPKASGEGTGVSTKDLASAKVSGDVSVPSSEEIARQAAETEAANIKKCAERNGTWNSTKQKCSVSFFQQVKNAANIAQSAASTISNGLNTYNQAVSGAKNIGKAISNIGTNGNGLSGLLGSFSTAASTVGSSVTNVTTSVQTTGNTLEDGINAYGSMTGKDVKNSGVYDAIEVTKTAANNASSATSSVVNPTTSTLNAARSGVNAINSMTETLGIGK